MMRMFDACRPFWPCVSSYVTRCPSLRLLKPSPRISLKCAKRSLPPVSGVMKPKPLPSLNHLTVPVSVLLLVLMKFPLNGETRSTCRRAVETRKNHQREFRREPVAEPDRKQNRPQNDGLVYNY